MKPLFPKRERKNQSRLLSPVLWSALAAQLFTILVAAGVLSAGESDALAKVGNILLELLIAFGLLNDPTNGAAF